MPGLEMDPPTPKPPTPNSLKRQLEPKLPAVVIDSLPAQNGLEQAGTKKSPVVELNSEMNEVRFESPEMQLKSKQRPHFDTRLGAEVNKDIPDHAGENEDGDNDIVIGERRASVVSITSDLSDLGPESPQKPASLELSSQPVSSLNLQQTQVQPANAFAAMNGTQEPPRKRAKLSKEEQLDAALKRRVAAAEKAIEKERKDKERAELAAKREAEKAAKEQEKAEKEAEREAEKKRKEAEKDEKRIAREKEAEKREEAKKAKEDEKKRKEEEKRKAEEEKAKKEGKQQKLNAFFMKPASKNASAGSSPTKTAKAASSEKETAKSEEEKRLEEYEKTFPAFFVQNNVTLAPITRAERDAGATQRLENNIDDFLSGRKSLDLPKRFSVTEAFNMPSICFPQRGRAPIPVKSIMASILGATSSKPIDLSIDAYNAQIRSTRNQLKSVKYKFLKFAEDVRPPYVGTYTKEPHCGFKRLARNPMQRELPGVDYDYDSEAEWEPPGEDEEELGSEDEDEEEGDVEDFDGFLDDAEDELTRNRKMGVGVSELEPISSGLCWEDERGQSSRVELHNFRMDILNENIRSNTPIDPFSTAYWPQPVQPSMQAPRNPLTTLSQPNTSNQPALTSFLKPPSSAQPSSSAPKPINNIQNLVRTSNATAKPKKLLEGDNLKMFKDSLQDNELAELSKIGFIEVLHKRFSGTGVAKGTIKNTLEAYCKREGVKEAEKRWVWNA